MKKISASTQKIVAKVFYWLGATLFIGATTTAVVWRKIADTSFTREVQSIVMIILSIGIGALCFGIINFSIYLVCRRGLAPHEVKIPGKYYLLIVVFLALLGLSII